MNYWISWIKRVYRYCIGDHLASSNDLIGRQVSIFGKIYQLFLYCGVGALEFAGKLENIMNLDNDVNGSIKMIQRPHYLHSQTGRMSHIKTTEFDLFNFVLKRQLRVQSAESRVLNTEFKLLQQLARYQLYFSHFVMLIRISEILTYM